MFVSALLTSLPLPFEPAVQRLAALGFNHVDVVGLADRPPEHREALADGGVLVSCAAVGRGLPEGLTLDAVSAGVRREAVELVKRQIADAAGLGAIRCYVVPGREPGSEGLLRFADACSLLAEYAGSRMMRLCVEHLPGSALPTADATLTWLDRASLRGVGILLDVGHCLLSLEDPCELVVRAGERLGYVHLDDNDGTGDLHWPLLSGKLTEAAVGRLVTQLSAVGYEGALCLELNAANPSPDEALRAGKCLLDRLMVETTHVSGGERATHSTRSNAAKRYGPGG